MAILDFFSFDLYGTDADLQADGWSLVIPTNIHVVTSGGRFGAGGVRIEQTAQLARPVSIGASTFGIQFAFKHESLVNATDETFVAVWNNSGVDLCAYLTITTAGEIRAKDGAATIVGTSPVATVKEGVWQYIAVKFVIGDTGSIVVYVDDMDTPVINATSVDTKPGAAVDVDRFYIQGASDFTGVGVVVDDVALWDDSGTENNDFLGEQRVYTLLPNADTVTANFSSQPAQGAGDTYLNVDDPFGSDDKDSSYVYSDTPSNEHMWEFEDLIDNPASICAVKVDLSAKKSDAGARTMAPLLQSDLKEAGTTFSPGTDYELHGEIWERTTESTPALWTRATVNAAKAGGKIVA
jgi:hypothetical protein